MAEPSDSTDQQLDALIARIQSLSGDTRTAATEASETSPAARAVSMSPSVPAASLTTYRPPEGGQPSSKTTAVVSAATTPRPPATGSTVAARPAANPSVAGNPTKDCPAGFQPTRDETWRPREPTDLASARINESLLEAILFRYLLSAGESEGRRMADQVQLPFRLVEPLLERFKKDHLVAYKRGTATNDYVYILTEAGRTIARNYLQDSTYYGSCPVRLQDYVDSVRYQTIEGQYPRKADLQRAFSDLLINPKMLSRLGPAVASGRGMFLFGFPGNGKTSIAERVTTAFGKYVWVPRAIDVEGEVMRVFDPMNHTIDMPSQGTGFLESSTYDKRWVRIRRPTIVAGGELTMEMLEVLINRNSNVSEAPLQMKSNCGTLVIDDFGRQKMSVDQLLNRWIIPLEKRYDFLNMGSGKKIQVPFDQLVIFSTNLEPRDLVDDAFLRRIPYKIEVENPPEADFRQLFVIMCKVLKMPYDADAVDYLVKTHYLAVQRPFRNCQPRDLLLQVRNFCLYNDLPIELKKEYFDFACDNYFSVM